MAKKIKETPILHGQDAINFLENMINTKPLPKKELKKLEKSYKIIKSISKDNIL